MGGFSVPQFGGGGGTGRAGLAPEPVEGDTLTKSMRALLNSLGSTGASTFDAGGQILGSGQGILNQGAGTIGQGQGIQQTGQGETQQGLNQMQQPLDYWLKILAGDPQSLASAAGPTSDAISKVFAGANSNASQNLPAGGYRSTSLAAQPQAQAAQVSDFLLGLQPAAAGQIASIANQEAQIGLGQQGVGLGQQQVGLGQQQVGLGQEGVGISEQGVGLQQLLAQLQGLLTRRGQNNTVDTSNLGLLTQGLESLVPGVSLTHNF